MPPPPAQPPPPAPESGLSRPARIVIFVCNSLGFALFLAWLISLHGQPVMREQEGILYFLPCLPFLFVYLMLMPRKKPQPPPEESATAEPPPPADGQSPADAAHAPRDSAPTGQKPTPPPPAAS